MRAKQAVATAAETVAQYELQEIEAARVRQNAEYRRDAETAKTDKVKAKARADELVALNDQVAAERARAVRLNEQERIDRERAEKARGLAEIAQGDLSNARDLASIQAAMADTNEERRKAALRLLDLDYELERVRLQAIIDSKTASDAEKETARRRQATLGDLKAAEQQGVLRNTESPFESYARRRNRTPGQVREEVEAVVVRRLEEVEDGITDALSNAIGVKDPLIKDLLKILLQEVLFKPIAEQLAKASGAAGAGGGGIGATLGGLLGAYVGGPAGAQIGSALGSKISGGRAAGGPVGAGQTYLVGEEGPELLRMGGASGTIIPNHQITPVNAMQIPNVSAMNASARPVSGTIKVVVEAGDGFNARIAKISGPIAQQVANGVVQGAAPEIVRQATRGAVAVMPAALQHYETHGTRKQF